MKARLIHFVESPNFTDRIDKLASLEVLLSLQNDLVRDPELGDLMAGCAGARKGRVGDKAAGKGKSGGFRYVYVYIVIAGTIYLIHFTVRTKRPISRKPRETNLRSWSRN